MSPQFTVSQATEADLPAMVDIQFKCFDFLAIEKMVFGPDTPENQASTVEMQRSQIEHNSGLRIAKLEVHYDQEHDQTNNNNDDSSTTTRTTAATTTTKPTPPLKSQIIGFSMFYLPNIDAATPEEVLPTPLRPLKQAPQATHVADAITRKQAEDMLVASKQNLLEIVADRPCGYVRYMCIHPAYQRKGLGTLLMKWGCQLFDDNATDAFLVASEGGEGLYRKFDFEKIGISFVPDGKGGRQEFSAMWRNCKPSNK